MQHAVYDPAKVIAIANISYFKCKYIEHTSRGSTHTLALYLGLDFFYLSKQNN